MVSLHFNPALAAAFRPPFLRHSTNPLLTCRLHPRSSPLLQVTRERIRQIEAKAIRKLRSPSRIGQMLYSS